MMVLLNVAWFTVKQALLSTFLALLLGIPAAFLVSKRRFVLRPLLLSFSAIPLAVPPLLIALGFVLFYGMQGVLNRILVSVFNLSESPVRFLYSLWGIVVAHGFYNFPVVMRIVGDAWQNLSRDEEDAASLLGAGKARVFTTVTLFKLAPALGASAVLVFLYCFFSFIIVLLFGSVGGTTLEVEIYHAARNTLDTALTVKLAVFQSAIALLVVALYTKIALSVRGSGLALHTADKTALEKKIQSGREAFFVSLYFLVLLLFFIGPFAAIGWNAFVSRDGGFSFNSFKVLFSRPGFRTALFNTLFCATGTALLSLFVASAFAFWERIVDSDKSSTLLRVVPMLPMAISSVVTGIVITAIVPRGNAFLLIVAQTALIWPFSYRQIASALDRVPQNLIEASRLLSPKKTDILFKIFVPLCKNGLISGFAFTFAISAGDASLPLVMAIPRFETLALFTYRLAGAYRFSEACASGLVLVLLTSFLFFVGGESGLGR